MALSPRLQAIYDAVPEGKTFADIGTDHGYLAAALLRTGKCPSGIASDINPMPLKKAETLLQRQGLSEQAQCRLGSGLAVLAPGETDVIIMAGMGGYLMADLLQSSQKIAQSAFSLILQPMNNAAVLRRFLQSNGYMIIGERVVQEGELFYQMMTVSVGEMPPLPDIDAMIGYGPCQTRDAVFERFIRFLIGKTEKTILKVSPNSTDNAQKRVKECQALLSSLQKVLDEVTEDEYKSK